MSKIVNISSAVATGAMIFSLMAPAAFAADVTVSGNGAGSNNDVNVSNSNTTTVSQSNTTTVVTEVVSSANTGGNSASYNVGGSSSVDTGNATSTVGVSVSGSANTASVTPCGCLSNPLTIDVSGNGANSKNKVKSSNSTSFGVSQTNSTLVQTGIVSKAKTGKNKANYNVGGSSSVTTGDSTSSVGVTVTGPSNTL